MRLTKQMKTILLSYLWSHYTDIEIGEHDFGDLKPLLPLTQDVNSMFYWWPLIAPLEEHSFNIKYPKTTLISYKGNPHKDIEENSENWVTFIHKVKEVTDEYGYPVFIRTGGTSNKHGWRETCFLARPEDLAQQIYNLFQFTLLIMGIRMDFDGIIVREFLDIQHNFTAFNDMPVGKEFRFFIKDADFQCYHPYWPPSAINRPSVDNWEELLLKDHVLGRADAWDLVKKSEVIAENLDKGILGSGYWSFDWCYTTDGNWYLTDLAKGEDSFHWPLCKHASDEMKNYDDPYDTSEILGPTAREKQRKVIREKYGLDFGD